MSKDETVPEEYIVISLDDGVQGSSQEVSLEKVRKILRAYDNDLHDYMNKTSSNRLGKILTIVDGSISDPTQRKAIKDMVNNVWYFENGPDGQHAPRLEHATQAIGFDLWNHDQLEPVDIVTYNKYKEL